MSTAANRSQPAAFSSGRHELRDRHRRPASRVCPLAADHHSLCEHIEQCIIAASSCVARKVLACDSVRAPALAGCEACGLGKRWERERGLARARLRPAQGHHSRAAGTGPLNQSYSQSSTTHRSSWRRLRPCQWGPRGPHPRSWTCASTQTLSSHPTHSTSNYQPQLISQQWQSQTMTAPLPG